MLDVTAADLHPGSGTLSPLLAQPGVSLSIRNLMELMLRISDNSATDMLLARAGGSEAVTARMRALGIDGIRVDRPTALLIADRYGAALPAPPAPAAAGGSAVRGHPLPRILYGMV